MAAMKSLVVEDNSTTQKLMQIYLSKLGTVDIAINGREAIDACKDAIKNNDHYDLVCMDIRMPEVDGLEALREIRRIEEENKILSDSTKVIMTTAKDRPADIFAAFNHGCEAYMIKPVHKSDLFAEIDKLGLVSLQ